MRATNAVARLRRRKRIFRRASGFVGGRSKLRRTAIETIRRADRYATRDRKVKKRLMRNLWVIRINASTRAAGMAYSHFIAGLKKANILLDRRQLAEMAVNDPAGFSSLVERVKASV